MSLEREGSCAGTKNSLLPESNLYGGESIRDSGGWDYDHKRLGGEKLGVERIEGRGTKSQGQMYS